MEKNVKKLLLLLILLISSGCRGLEQDLARDLVTGSKIKLDRCEVEGFRYDGIDRHFTPSQPLKILMVHGVGTHHPGYSRRIQENLAADLGLDVRSRLPKNVYLRDPAHPETSIGNLRVTYWENRAKTQKMLFYELTWSEITTPDKKIIAFDTTEQYSKFRVPFNNTMKVFLDNTLPDPLVYLIDPGHLILNSNKQALCWMLKSGWNDIPDNKAEVCQLSPSKQIAALDGQNLMFITHSLGSKILMDTLTATSDNISMVENNPAAAKGDLAAIRRLRDKSLTVFMLANQLPILQIGHPLPKVHNQINAYCHKGGSKYNSRIFKDVNIVAFSDPNDLLSYAIPQDFADKYIDSRICPRVTNVSVNVAPEITAFGIGVVNPVSAHTDYDNSPKVINLITHGTVDFYQDSAVDNQCRFILLEKDDAFH